MLLACTVFYDKVISGQHFNQSTYLTFWVFEGLKKPTKCGMIGADGELSAKEIVVIMFDGCHHGK